MGTRAGEVLKQFKDEGKLEIEKENKNRSIS